MSHDQLISRNSVDLSDVIRTFHELNECYQEQFVIYMDSHNWALFATRVSKTIISHAFKHFNQFTADIHFKNYILNGIKNKTENLAHCN